MRKPKTCPKCGSKRVVKITYGMPLFSKQLRCDLDAKRIVLGGCEIDDDSPVWACVACEHRWGQMPAE